ncbi:MAG: SEC-C domain-containing protein [Colwellia sp.]|nr:SEC-C domain-containing protein [Colwellia sp.]
MVELTVLLNKQDTVKLDKLPRRNDPCGSGNKYKQCCG